MTLRGGRRGLLVNAANLCAAPQSATARFVGHANRGVSWHPAVTAGCAKKKKRHHNGHKRHKRKGTHR
jgi:hypothetical protein